MPAIESWTLPWTRTTAAFARVMLPPHDHLRSIARQQPAAVWVKDCLCRPSGLSPKPIEMQSPCRRNPN